MTTKKADFRNIDTVGKLRDFLKEVPDDTELYVSSDGDGTIGKIKITYWHFENRFTNDEVEIEIDIIGGYY